VPSHLPNLSFPLLRRPTFFSLALLAFGLVFFVSLGNWQLGRARYKEVLYAGFVKGSAGPKYSLAEALKKWPAESYVAVQIKGEFVAGKTVLWDSQTRDGQVGVQVFQAFRSGENTVLVALGYMPVPQDRSVFPTPDVPSGERTLTGLIAAPPSSGIKLGEFGPPPNTPTWLVTRIEPPQLAPFFGVPLPAPVLLLDPVPASASADAGNVLLLPRVWHPNTFPPERHRGYAATWFGFAFTAIIIFLLLHRKPR
jgi:surfeit locus 1 family protein